MDQMDEVTLGLRQTIAQLKTQLAKEIDQTIEYEQRCEKIIELIEGGGVATPLGRILAIAKGEMPDD